MSTDYTMTVHLDVDPATAEERVTAALADEGFGILTEIDVQGVLHEKLGVEMAAYRILGACNPQLAHQALQEEADVGALLPCNVVVRANPDGGTDVVAADPHAMLGVADVDGLQELADDARSRIGRALEAATAG